jgi:hypothetical protein
MDSHSVHPVHVGMCRMCFFSDAHPDIFNALYRDKVKVHACLKRTQANSSHYVGKASGPHSSSSSSSWVH